MTHPETNPSVATTWTHPPRERTIRTEGVSRDAPLRGGKMHIVSTSLARCSLGKRDQFLGLALEGMKLFERHGAAHARLLQAHSAGQGSDVYALTNEFDSAEAYGGFVDDLYHDAEFEAFMARITGPDSGLTIVSRTLETEVPLDRSGPAQHGAIVSAYIGRPEQGRFEDCRELARRLFSFVEAHGGSNCRLFELDSAGARTGELMARWEFETMHAYGRALDAWGTDPEAQSLVGWLRGPDAPITLTWSGLYRDLHM
jgi:hypothetical protein